MVKSKQPPDTSHEQTLEELLDKVGNTREELVAIERSLERLRADIAKTNKQKNGSGKTS
jgi:phage shock protein A